MTNRPQHPPAESYSLHMAPHILRPTSPPPPRKNPEEIIIHTSAELRDELRNQLAEARTRNQEQQRQIMLLRGEIGSLTERLGKHECPDCGDAEQIVDCHHDGTTCGVPECTYRHCNGCGHQWGHN